MKAKLLLSITLMSLFAAACETVEEVQPKEADRLATGIENNSYITSADGGRDNLLAEERIEPALTRRFGKQVSTSYGYSETSSMSRSGSKSARFELRKGGGAIRSEIWRESETSRNRWYGLSLYLPSGNWGTDMDPDAWDMITQWHGVDDSGEPARTPPISLVVMKGRLCVVVYWNTRSINTNSTSGKKVFDIGAVEKGKWLDFVYHINFSPYSEGVLQVWKNGSKVVDYRGPNSYNDKVLPYLKAGIYKRNWNSISSRVVFMDEIRVGGPSATYNDVAPGNGGVSQPDTDDDDDDDDDETSGQKLASFTLINADTERDIMTISNGATIDLSNIGTRNLNIRANTSPEAVGSVAFNLTGAHSLSTTQAGKPYALFGDSGGNYNAWRAVTGSYTLKATPYTEANKGGTAGTTLTVGFKIVE